LVNLEPWRRMDDGRGALTQLTAWLAQQRLGENDRLPPERELSRVVGVSRGELRKALAALEADGKVWRHVGKGTFVGGRPATAAAEIGAAAARTNPHQVMRARLLVEPVLAVEAATNACAEDIAAMRDSLSGSVRAETWREYEVWDNRLHRLIATAARNPVLLAMFDTMNDIRRAVVWGRLRAAPERPPRDHHSFADHAAVVAAIAERDGQEAARAMRRHLTMVQHHLLGAREAAE
jgi:DNA-binding FadR family transcriptional regulator